MKLKAVEISAFLAFILCLGVTLTFDSSCNGIRDKVLRLHVIANSDSVDDQSLKYAVRDALLQDGEDIFQGSDTAFEAEEKIGASLLSLKNTAEETVHTLGYDYDVNIEIANTYFPTREYENVTLPAGYYRAVRVVIGEGKGKNWWCVMFPPLCLPAASEENPDLEDILDEKELDIVSSGEKYEIRFWFVEKYYELKEKFVK